MKKFTIEERVRWGDVDAARIIFYGSYIRFFEIAETELFRSVGMPYGKVFDELDIWLPRVHLECDFHRASQLDDLLAVSVYLDIINLFLALLRLFGFATGSGSSNRD